MKVPELVSGIFIGGFSKRNEANPGSIIKATRRYLRRAWPQRYPKGARRRRIPLEVTTKMPESRARVFRGRVARESNGRQASGLVSSIMPYVYLL